MTAEAWVALGALIVAIVSIVVAMRANSRADTANRHADEANSIAREANKISIEASNTAREVLAIEENRERIQSRPTLTVKLGESHKARASYDVTVSHDGTQPLDEVTLRVTDMAVATFFPGMQAFGEQGGVLPQDEARYLGTLSVGEVRGLEILWRDFGQRVATIVGEIRMGDDRWSTRHELDIDDDSRFD